MVLEKNDNFNVYIICFSIILIKFGEFSAFDPPLPPHSPKGVINGFREKCPIWMFIQCVSLPFKKRIFQFGEFSTFDPPVPPHSQKGVIDGFKNSKFNVSYSEFIIY